MFQAFDLEVSAVLLDSMPHAKHPDSPTTRGICGENPDPIVANR